MQNVYKITTCQKYPEDIHPAIHWEFHRFTQCGEPVVPGRSYCEEHLWGVYRKGTAKGIKADQKNGNPKFFSDLMDQLEDEVDLELLADADRFEEL
jgi:hypothetical protein